jgi:PAS domain S-box-containing protein
MMRTPNHLTGHERTFPPDDIIVSKTDVKGIITYANDVFIRVSGYDEEQLLGKPHNLIRHPDMPRAVFKLLWDALAAGQEIFAYVVNRARNGDHYWVLAHVTPVFAANGSQIVGYHSSRRAPSRSAVEKVIPLYRSMLGIEAQHNNRDEGMQAALTSIASLLQAQGTTYDEFVLSL